MMNSLSLWKVVWHSLRFFFRTQASVALGIAAATAVVSGALVVGDSVRGSLLGLVLDRLANIECLLHSRTFFDPQILRSVSSRDVEQDTSIVPLIFLSSCAAEKRDEDRLRRATGVQVLAVGDDFWKVIKSGNARDVPIRLAEDEVAVNASLARELDAAIGDELTLKLSRVTGVPADSPLGRRDDTSINLPRQKLVAVLPDDGIGSVSFSSMQSVPRNVFCSPETMQDALQCGSRVNAAVVVNLATADRATAISQHWCDELNERLRPRIEDYGLRFERITRAFPSADHDEVAEDSNAESAELIYDYCQVTSNELIIDNATANAVAHRFGPQVKRLYAYLANSIAKVEPLSYALVADIDVRPDGSVAIPKRGPEGGLAKLESREVPYSIIVAIDDDSALALDDRIVVAPEELRRPYCWINSWLAEQLDANAGDWIQVNYFEPEIVDGMEKEDELLFMVAGVVPLTEPVRGFRRDTPAQYASAPTIFNDPNFTPHVPGLTDRESISNWDAPFKLRSELILPADDDYYGDHRLTPKVFMRFHSMATARILDSRFGRTTGLRFPAKDFPDEEQLRVEIEDALLPMRALKGLSFVAVRANLLKSASGTTPFDMLFLSLSFFVIVAALLLVTILFKLGIQQRASQLGILAAQGFSAGRIRRLLLCEMSLVALLGAGVGIVLGLAYARAMIAALESWWVGAISSPFLQFSFTWRSLMIGAIAGVLASLTTIYWSIRNMSQQPPLGLLRNQFESTVGQARFNRIALTIAGFVALGAVAFIIAGLGQSGMSRAGTFFGSGMLLLMAAVIVVREMLKLGTSMGSAAPERGNLFTLAWRAICRNPLRSTLALGLLSVASFLIASMGGFHVSPNPRGYGGFDLLGESSLPIYRNIGTRGGRSQVLGARAESLRDTTILPLRARAGEDASCNNLFQVAQPTVLGIPARLSDLHDFSADSARFDWAAAANPKNPWKALSTSANGTPMSPIPVILDQNTAAWSLKQGASLDSIIILGYGNRRVYFRTVGLLFNSVLQGKLLISEGNFQRLFPELSGYRFFLIRTGDRQEPDAVAEALEEGWSDAGMDVTSSRQTLERMLGVQNTYLSAFQSLGALGLLLGTFGLVAVQLRSVLERRRELALMQAVGFSKVRLTRMLVLETAILLGGGLAIGVLAAAIALVPYVVENGPAISVVNPLFMLCVVLIAGFIAALIAVRAAMRSTILSGLRSE